MSNTPTRTSVWVTAAAIIGGFVIFVLILTVAYLPNQAEPIPQGTKTPAERLQALTELRAKEQKVATSYAWIDQQKGTVQLPTERAMELTIEELKAKK
ncbi:hypothetical protein DB347_11235 [Opitutaceae bacterium EW11]|nr:hypothetical protein DB347_11235 [Opitutaceae bacterium EW11]